MTIQRISGSPVAMYAFDLNSSIFTEDGEFIYYGPYQLYMSGVSDVQVKWTLENRSANPGIFEGDMFLSNDPWVGAAHQTDVTLLNPVFWEGRLFCWITNVLHQYDVGGITPGSFCPNARDAFDEGILIPPIKIVERGELRRDVEGVYLRASRKPYLVALDLRAQIAGNVTATRRITQLIARYGPEVVKGVMRKIIDHAEAAFLAKMASLPDGTWRERSYVEVARVGDRGTYPVMLTMQKQGDRLVFDNAGTADQVGAINTTYSGWRGSILTALNELLCWDQLYAIGGALRHIEFRPALGAFTCATHPASVSRARVQAMEISLYPAYNTRSKLLSCHPELKRDAMCIGGTSQFPLTCFRGIDQWGERFGYLFAGPHGGRHRRLQLPGRDRDGRAGEEPHLPHRQRRAQRAELPPPHALPPREPGLGGRREVPRRQLRHHRVHPLRHARDRARDGVLGRRHPDGARSRGRLSRLHQRLRVQARHRHPGVVPRAAAARGHHGARRARRAAPAPPGRHPPGRGRRLRRGLRRRRRLRRPHRARSRGRPPGRRGGRHLARSRAGHLPGGAGRRGARRRPRGHGGAPAS